MPSNEGSIETESSETQPGTYGATAAIATEGSMEPEDSETQPGTSGATSAISTVGPMEQECSGPRPGTSGATVAIATEPQVGAQDVTTNASQHDNSHVLLVDPFCSIKKRNSISSSRSLNTVIYGSL